MFLPPDAEFIIIVGVGLIVITIVLQKIVERKWPSKPPEQIVKVIIETQEKQAKVYGKEHTIKIEPIVEKDVIHGEGVEASPRHLLVANSDIPKDYVFVESFEAVYIELKKFLIPEASMGFDYFLSYKTAIETDDKLRVSNIKQGLDALSKLRGYRQPVKWYRTFEEVEKNGNLEGIILPLVKKDLYGIKPTQTIQNAFSNFVSDLSLERGVPKLGTVVIEDKKISVIPIGSKGKDWRNYVLAVSSMKTEGHNIIILCASGHWIRLAVDVSEIVLSKIFPNLKRECHFNSSNVVNKDGEKVIISNFFIFLRTR